MTTPIISQELFDETILENEECFDLTPAEALRETIDQFCQQLIGQKSTTSTDHHQYDDDPDEVVVNNSTAAAAQQSSILLPAAMAHLTLSHPSTPHGQVERANRSNFQQWLSLLDDCVAADGMVALPDDDNDDTMMMISDALSQLAAKFKAGTGSLSLPYLILFQQSCSIYTLLSFLTTFTILQQPPQAQADEATIQNNNVMYQQQQQQQLQLLHQVTQTLTAILTTCSPPRGESVQCAVVRA